MELTKISPLRPQYQRIEQLWLDAFPAEERRPTETQRRNASENPLFSCFMASESGTPVGFITWWDFGQFGYCEHFATFPELRGGGLGAKVIAALLSVTGKPLVLEVERPETPMARRRIGFYQRCGLELHPEIDYVQPPYSPTLPEVPMMIMSSPGLDRKTLESAISSIHSHVYLHH